PIEDDRLVGIEGTAWYVTEPSGRVAMFKCKPESVEAIHWAVGINKAAVVATCWNLLETSDELTYEALLPLLLEEYTGAEIAAFRPHIDRALAEVRAQVEFRDRVLAAYAATGLSLQEDKATVMRTLAPHFARSEMKKVYSVLARHALA
ncbi:MAG: hypothetical protein KKB13_05235, partial [Chloroflexi bacterium]|nr:hypothetical protein [Chloroflexota bacterium]